MMYPPIPSKRDRPSIASIKGPPSTRSYSTLPSLAEWQSLTNTGRVKVGAPPAWTRTKRANDPVLRTIDDLVKELHAAQDGEYLYLLGQLFFATIFWLNHWKKDSKILQDVYGDAARQDNRKLQENRKPILSLNLFAANQFANLLNWQPNEVASKLKQLYGVNMSDYGLRLDKGLDYGAPRAGEHTKVRRRFQVFMMGGRAYHYSKATNSLKLLNTTRTDNQNTRDGGMLFVLSMSNELYVFTTNYTHSMAMKGRDVQCAGTMQFNQGVVTYVINDSGHYKPVDVSMVKVLQYLKMNGMELKRIAVGRMVLLTKGTKVKPDIVSGTIPGNVFMQKKGNWSAIMKRQAHQH